MMKNLSTVLIFISFSISCSKFIKSVDENYYDIADSKSSDHLSLIFSHNINGETHPCGCRNFPLGGLPQVKGELFQQRDNSPVIYVDSGDALFPSTNVPKFLEKSQLFTAKKIAESFDLNRLDYFTPGDQDFAYGIDFLGEISKKVKFKFVLSNIKANKKIKSSLFEVKKVSNRTLVFIGVLDPELLDSKLRGFFTSPTQGIRKAIKEIKNKFELKKIKIILLSHSGMDKDKKIAKIFPEISWIIGAHSQAFTQKTIDVGNTRIVQVLSRNHYLGKIKILHSKSIESNNRSSYSLIEVRDELKLKEKNNPMIAWLDKYKVSLDAIQLQEQKDMGGDTSILPANTASSCIECHKEQSDFWKKTSHSLAFITLDHSKSANNPNCIKCHSLGYKSLKGFQNIDGMVLSDKKLDRYWAEFKETFKKIKSVRKLTSKERLTYSKKYEQLDQKFEVKHNFANVQCLNCHDKSHDHPFEMEENPSKTTNYQAKCLKCHTSDQSPEWYKKDNKGIATSVDQAYVSEIIKKISCPKRQE